MLILRPNLHFEVMEISWKIWALITSILLWVFAPPTFIKKIIVISSDVKMVQIFEFGWIYFTGRHFFYYLLKVYYFRIFHYIIIYVVFNCGNFFPYVEIQRLKCLKYRWRLCFKRGVAKSWSGPATAECDETAQTILSGTHFALIQDMHF